MSTPDRFWETQLLSSLTRSQWEALCDGCGRCCLYKFQDADTGEIIYTRVACKALDLDTCRCLCYDRRTELHPDCIRLDPKDTKSLAWLPLDCAYRCLHERRPLPEWHPLITGTSASVHTAGKSIRDSAVSVSSVPVDALETVIASFLYTILPTSEQDS
ncbi:MAG: hypothetical protein CSA22_07450 [Deltaproteobacteria bacterium]|nr:MAG: hypothetical protein CSA22_07450 [Deltaproteobacteria bacterium]